MQYSEHCSDFRSDLSVCLPLGSSLSVVSERVKYAQPYELACVCVNVFLLHLLLKCHVVKNQTIFILIVLYKQCSCGFCQC